MTKAGAKLALEKMLKYYDRLTSIYTVAAIFDPRLKLAYFEGNGWAEGQDGENLIETGIKPG